VRGRRNSPHPAGSGPPAAFTPQCVPSGAVASGPSGRTRIPAKRTSPTPIVDRATRSSPLSVLSAMSGHAAASSLHPVWVTSRANQPSASDSTAAREQPDSAPGGAPGRHPSPCSQHRSAGGDDTNRGGRQHGLRTCLRVAHGLDRLCPPPSPRAGRGARARSTASASTTARHPDRARTIGARSCFVSSKCTNRTLSAARLRSHHRLT